MGGKTGQGFWKKLSGPVAKDMKWVKLPIRDVVSEQKKIVEQRNDRFDYFSGRTSFDTTLSGNISWFPAYMNRASREISASFKKCCCIVEVRDSRAPLTSSNYILADQFTKHRIVLLNKADLVTPEYSEKSVHLLQSFGIPCLKSDATRGSNIVYVRKFILENVPLKQHRSIGTWFTVVGLPNVGKSTIVNTFKNIAHTEGTRAPPGNNIVKDVASTKARSGPLAGITRECGTFQISNKPKLFCIDTPGVMIPKQEDPEVMLKLAAIGCLDDYWVGPMHIGDYILFLLNRHRLFGYVDVLELSHPTDNIETVSQHIGAKLQRSDYIRAPCAQAGVSYFIWLFRNGHFGAVELDELPHVEEILAGNQREPPGPWGPSRSSDFVTGLK